MTKLNKQGVRDLNATGHNGHRNAGVKCRHYFAGPLVVVGHRWTTDPSWGSFEAYQEEILGKQCLWCNETKEVG